MILEQEGARSAGYAAGAIIGTLIGVGLASGATAKCVHVLRRPTTSKPCLVGLLLICIAWLASALLAATSWFVDLPSSVLASIRGVLVVVLLLAALVVGIVGLATYDTDRHTQGRAQGIWAVVISGLFFAVTIVVVVRGEAARLDNDGSGRAPLAIEKPAYNFGLTVTPPWVSMKPEAINAEACVVLRRTNPEVNCVVIAEIAGDDVELDRLVEVAMANLASAGEVLERHDERVPLHGSTFVRIATRTRPYQTNAPLAFEHWILTRRGFAWQFVFFGKDSERSTIAAEARRLMETFRILDPKRDGTGPGSLADVSRPELGYATQLAGSGWNAWPEGRETVPLADFCAQRTREALIVVPLRFDGEPPEIEALTAGLLAGLDFTYPDKSIRPIQPWLPFDGAKGLELETKRTLHGHDYRYLLRIARGRDCACLVAGWVSADGDLERLRAALDRIRLSAPRGAAPPQDSRQLAALGHLLNTAALSLLEKDAAAAVPWYGEAGAIAEQLLAKAPEQLEALQILGWSQMGREMYREAKETFERAARASPDDEAVQDALRTASAALGQGKNSDVKTPIEPVPVPAEIAREIEAQQIEPGFGSGDALAFDLLMTAYHFVRGEPLRRTETCRARILTADGAAQLSSLSFPFDPLAERVYVNRVEVQDDQGRVVERGSLADAFVRDSDENDLATHRSVLHQPVPGLQPGRTLVWEATFEERAPAEAFGFERQLLAAAVPTAMQIVFVSGDTQAVRALLTRGSGVKSVASDGLSGWIVADPPRSPGEPLSVWPERCYPVLWLCGENGSWEEVSAKYLARIQDRLELDPAIEALAEKLTAEVTDERARIAALARYVQREITYKAIEFGVRAQRPNAAAETLRLRYGDCKDQALLLHLLLRAAGIESHLALVSHDWSIQPELPALDQFDHMVLHVPALGEERLLDVTDKHLDLVRYPADGLWESHALVLDPAHARLLAPTTRPADGYRIECRRLVTPDGADWRVEETLTLHGYFAAWARTSFGGLGAADRIPRLQALLADEGAAQVLDFRFDGLDDPAQPAELVQVYRIAHAISSSGEQRTGALPALWERYHLGLPFLAERRTPFEWLFPLRFESDVTVRLPSRPADDERVALRKALQSEFCAWKLEPAATDEARELTLHFEFEAKPGSYGAEAYARFHDAWQGALSAWDQPLHWSATP